MDTVATMSARTLLDAARALERHLRAAGRDPAEIDHTEEVAIAIEGGEAREVYLRPAARYLSGGAPVRLGGIAGPSPALRQEPDDWRTPGHAAARAEAT